MKKLIASLLCAAMLTASLAGCSGGAGGTTNGGSAGSTAGTPKGTKVTLKVWAAQDEQALLTEMTDEFKKANPDTTWDISFGVVGESDAQTKYTEDPAAAADVFMFENGQTSRFVETKALYEVTRNKEAIVAANSPGSVESASVGDKLYAYPMTADNGYFLYYDKSVISEEDVKSLDSMLAAADKAGKKIFMDVSNGWYIASFFLGAGCTMTAEAKNSLDFNNEKGVAAGEAIKAFTAHNAFVTGDDAVLTGGFGDTIVAGISGTWTAAAIKEKLGENFGATKLPTFTVGSEQKQMGSFAGYKLIGVNSLTKFPVEAMDLAEWLTNEENQAKRFAAREMGPSNIKVADSAEVKANLPLAALALQSQYATPQNNVPNDFYWNAAEAFGTAMETKDYSKSVKELLDAMVAQVAAGQE